MLFLLKITTLNIQDTVYYVFQCDVKRVDTIIYIVITILYKAKNITANQKTKQSTSYVFY